MEGRLKKHDSFLEPAADVMSQALACIRDAASKQQTILANVAIQTSPSLAKPLPHSSLMKAVPALPQIRTQPVPTQRVRAPPAPTAAVQPAKLFSALVAQPVVGAKRPHHCESEAGEEGETDEEEEDDEVSSRLARRVLRHRKMMAQSKALAPER
jgi:hypothetical protein